MDSGCLLSSLVIVVSDCAPPCVSGLAAGASEPSVDCEPLPATSLPALEAAEEAGVLSVVSVATDDGACDAAALLVGVVLAAESALVDLASSAVTEVASTKTRTCGVTAAAGVTLVLAVVAVEVVDVVVATVVVAVSVLAADEGVVAAALVAVAALDGAVVAAFVFCLTRSESPG